MNRNDIILLSILVLFFLNVNKINNLSFFILFILYIYYYEDDYNHITKENDNIKSRKSNYRIYMITKSKMIKKKKI